MSESKTNFGINLLTGGISGIIGTTTIFPIDLIKTRLQNNNRGHLNFFNLTRHVIQTEGFRGLYRGLLANVVGVAPEKAIKLASNDFFRGKLADLSTKAQGDPDKLPTSLGMLAGALAGTTQVIATNPMETVKIRMQMAAITAATTSASVGSMTMREIPSTFSVIKDLGLTGLYRGSLATLSRDVPFSMIFFQLFASFKGYFAKRCTNKDLEFPFIFASGISAGAIGAFLVTPMDGKGTAKESFISDIYVSLFILVVKTRYQATRSSKNMLTIYRSIYLFEGPGAFFKGALQRCFIVAPLFGISLTCYELQRQYLNKGNTSN